MKLNETIQHRPAASITTALVFFFSLVFASAFAQEHSFGKEENSSSNESVLENQHHDNDVLRNAPSGQDSVFIQRPVNRPRSKNSESTGSHQAEAAKFNFLYFIIEKFKFTDIID